MAELPPEMVARLQLVGAGRATQKKRGKPPGVGHDGFPTKPTGSAKNKRKGPFLGMIPYEVEKQMFATYCQLPNLSHVSRTLGISMFTVRKYAKEQDWENRRQDILKAAKAAADYDLGKATEQSIVLVRALKQKIAEKIKGLSAMELSTDSLVADTERLVKLEQILLGGVSDRSARINESHEDRIQRLKAEREKAIDITPKRPELTQ